MCECKWCINYTIKYFTNKKDNKLNEYNNHFEKYDNLELKYNKQCNVLIELKLNVNKLNNELTNEFNNTMNQFELEITEINSNKNNITCNGNKIMRNIIRKY